MVVQVAGKYVSDLTKVEEKPSAAIAPSFFSHITQKPQGKDFMPVYTEERENVFS